MTTTTSKQFTLNTRDLLRGLFVGVIAPILQIIIDSIQAGDVEFNWSKIGRTALIMVLTYLLKNFLSPAEIVIPNANPQDVKAIEQGQAKATIIQTS